MQVVCNQCHAVSEVDADRFAAPMSTLVCSACSAPLALPAVEIGSEPSWLVLMPGGQAGPYFASQMAELLDNANVDWSSLVWRAGLKGWRPARRDPQLVTSVASARGAGAYGDTQRISTPGRRSLLPATDTIVEPLKRALARSSADAFALAAAGAFTTESGDDFTQVTHRVVAPGEPTIGDAFRSAPSIVTSSRSDGQPTPDTQPVLARPSSRISWLPSVQSMLVVAVLAFAFGVLAAALWGRYFNKHQARPTTLVVRPSSARMMTAPEPVAPPVAPAKLAPPLAVESLATPPMPEVPLDADLRREVRRISPDVRRCIDNLSRGAEVEIYFDGVDGRVRDLRLRTLGLSPGRIECVSQAVKQMHLSSFRRPTYKFWHRFSY